jgi:hypothetical protein
MIITLPDFLVTCEQSYRKQLITAAEDYRLSMSGSTDSRQE